MEVHRRFEPKEVDGIGIVDEESDESDELEGGFKFSAGTGGDDESFADGDLPQALHGEFACEDDDGDPGFEPAHGSELNGGGHDHELISERVEKFSGHGDEVEFPSKVAVEEVGERSDGECGDGEDAEKRRLHGQANDDEGNEDDAEHRDGVWDVEEIFFDIGAEFISFFGDIGGRFSPFCDSQTTRAF